MPIRFCLIPLAALLCSAVSAHATSTTAQSTAAKPEITNLAPVTVSGVLRGPALLRVAPDGYLSTLAAKGYVITTPQG